MTRSQNKLAYIIASSLLASMTFVAACGGESPLLDEAQNELDTNNAARENISDADDDDTTGTSENPTTTASTTTTTTKPATTTTTEPQPIVHEGTGSAIVPVDVGDDVWIVRYSAESGTTTILGVDDTGRQTDLILNHDRAPATGAAPLGFSEYSRATAIEIETEGAWRIEITSLSKATVWDGAAPVSGANPDVLVFAGDATAFLFSCGDGYCGVGTYDEDGLHDGEVNEVGPYSGDFVEQGAMVFVINAHDWSLSVR